MANPLRKRHWHNPKNPAQAARIEAAAAKRQRKALKLDRSTMSSVLHNPAHCSYAYGRHDEAVYAATPTGAMMKQFMQSWPASTPSTTSTE